MKFVVAVLGFLFAFSELADAQEVVWNYKPPVGSVDASPAVADMDGDGAVEIVAGTTAGIVVSVDGNGKERWRRELPGRICFPITAADVMGDAAPEALAINDLGQVFCMKGDTGAVLWDTDLPGTAKWGTTALCAADVDGDGGAEIALGLQDGTVVCLRGTGEQAWAARTPCLDVLCPAVADVNGDGTPEVLVGGSKVPLVCLSDEGKELWRLDGGVGGSPFVCNLDGQGPPEILVGVDANLVAVSGEGKVLWRFPLHNPMDSALAFGDADGDGQTEIYVADLSGYLACVSLTGQARWSAEVEDRVRRSPSMGDVDGDGVVEILVAGYSRALFVFDPQGRLKARVPLLGSVNSTPTLASLAQNGLCAIVPVVGDGVKAFRWPNAKPDGKALWPEFRFDARRLGMGPMVGGQTAATLPVAHRTRTMKAVSFANEFSDAEKALREVETRSAHLADARGLEDRACFLLEKLKRLREQTAGAGLAEDETRVAVREALEKILEEARPLAELARAAEEAVQSGGPVGARAANPWAPFGGMDELKEGRLAPPDLTVKAFAGEKESAALNVFNLSSIPRTFCVELDALGRGGEHIDGGAAVSLFEVVEVHTEMQRQSPDALPRLNSGNQLQVPAWSARQLWLNVDTRALTPGEWTGTLRLRSLDRAPLDLSCPLNITVWHTALPAKQALRHCGWGYVESSFLKKFPEAGLEDQIQHGTNVFVCTSAPKGQFDGEGNLIGELDYGALDGYVKRHAPHGIILFCGYQGGLQGPAPVESDIYGKAHVAWLRVWTKHLSDLGVGYEGYALYPVDEPGLLKGRVEAYLRMARLAREADPKILMYTDPVGGITMDELREMQSYVDIWCPNRAGLVLPPEFAEKLDFILKTGKPVWTYECFANAKHQSPLAYYRGQAWLAWQHGLTGIGFWTYCTSAENPWFVSPGRSEYTQVYPGNGVVSSKRWEALRDGIEDYSLLTALREAVNAKGIAAGPENIEAARRLLGEQAGAIGNFCDAKTDEIDFTSDGFPGLRRLEDQRWKQIQAAREDLAKLLDVFGK